MILTMQSGFALLEVGYANPRNTTSVLMDPNPNFKPRAMQQQRAIEYIDQIQNRFTNEPETYKSFLRISRTYQKEEKGIKDVLEQVSTLFADHIDLSMGFTYFLPDAVQDQARDVFIAQPSNRECAKTSICIGHLKISALWKWSIWY